MIYKVTVVGDGDDGSDIGSWPENLFFGPNNNLERVISSSPAAF